MNVWDVKGKVRTSEGRGQNCEMEGAGVKLGEEGTKTSPFPADEATDRALRFDATKVNATTRASCAALAAGILGSSWPLG